MSWHFLRGRAEVSWPHTYLDGAPAALLRLMPTAATCSSPDSGTGTSPASPCGTTSAPLTDAPGGATSTSSLEGSPARTSPRRVAEEDLPESVRGFGSRCSESLERCGLRMSSRRTVRTCVPVDSAPSSRDLPAWGMMRNGECWELGTSVRPTDATECGLLPTYVARDHRSGKASETTHNRNSRPLNEVIQRMGHLPTPTAAGNEASPSMLKWPAHRRLQRLLPTPSARLYGNNQGGAAGRTGPKRPSIDVLTGGPWIAFREWMMGWPIGWTASKPLATDRFRRWLHSHGGS